MTIRIRRASKPVFEEQGFATEEAAKLPLRSELMTALLQLIERRGLSQARAAALIGVSQPRISDLARGKIDRSSVDTLIAMLGHAGAEVRVTDRGWRDARTGSPESGAMTHSEVASGAALREGAVEPTKAPQPEN